MVSAQPAEKQTEMWSAVAAAAGKGKIELTADVMCVAGKR
jgi:hypothetical protein